MAERRGWEPSRDLCNYADGQLTVTITLAEYRYLVARVAAMDEREQQAEKTKTKDE